MKQEEFDKWEREKLEHEKRARKFYKKLSIT
jgi:hypothetical protein